MSSIPGLSDSLLTSLGAVRKAYPQISYEGVDVSATFIPSLKSFTYKDSFAEHCLADTLEIELADPEGLFRKSWSLKTGQTVTAAIVVENWNGPGTGKLTKQLGTMFIKSVRLKQTKGAGTSVRISCSSIDPATSFRLEKKSRAWTASTVRDVANQIALDNSLALKYTPTTNPTLSRFDQHDMSDAVALERACDPNDFLPKIVNGQLWIRDRHEVETSAPVGTIVCPSTGNVGGVNGSGVLDWEFVQNVEDADYAAATVSWKNNTDGNTVSATVPDPNQTGNAPHLIYHRNIYGEVTEITMF
jgi:hypothetical protein